MGSSRERSAASRGISRETSGGGRQGWGRQLEPQLWLSFSFALMSSQRGTHSALSQPSQEDACAEAFSQDSRGVSFQDKGCHSIIYGGCGGGRNLFVTVDECEAACGDDTSTRTNTRASTMTTSTSGQTSQEEV